jgi:hypothetical protein
MHLLPFDEWIHQMSMFSIMLPANRGTMIDRFWPLLAELARNEMQQAGGSLAIANGKLVVSSGPTRFPNIPFL